MDSVVREFERPPAAQHGLLRIHAGARPGLLEFLEVASTASAIRYDMGTASGITKVYSPLRFAFGSFLSAS